MKSVKYIIFSACLFLSVSRATACVSYSYTPGEYYTFRAVNPLAPHPKRDVDKLSVEMWRQYTRQNATVEDIFEVVYKYPSHKLQGENLTSDPNTFIRHLVSKNDTLALNYLILAKRCQVKRSLRNDKWWYPNKEDLEFADMRSIIDEALKYKRSKLGIRYLLQAIRAAYTANDYDLCLKLWNEDIKKLPKSVVRDMCQEYIGGIWFRKGNYQLAIEHNAAANADNGGFWWSARHLGLADSDVERIKVLYNYFPNSPQLEVMLQDMCRQGEGWSSGYIFNGDYGDSRSNYIENRTRFIELRDFALDVVEQRRCSNIALWQYTAAFLTMIDGDTELALKQIVTAKRMHSTQFISESIEILETILRAMTGSYDTQFEHSILMRLRRLDDMMVKHIKEVNPSQYYDKTQFYNISFYYYNDMMRKVTLSIMARQYIRRGESEKALFLTGMASERMRMLINYRAKAETKTWNCNFRTDLFAMLDTAPIASVVRYAERMKTGGRTALERFCAKRSYYNADFFNEIIATRYMREEQFDKAAHYFSLVSSGYDSTLNISKGYLYDPNREPFIKRYFVDNTTDYKASFARQMADLQQLMNAAKYPALHSEMAYRYGQGLIRASTDCWALLSYRWESVWNHSQDRADYVPHWLNKLHKRGVMLIDEAYRDSCDPELKARCFATRMWLSIYNLQPTDAAYKKDAAELTSKFGNTVLVNNIGNQCDTYKSYLNDCSKSLYLQLFLSVPTDKGGV